MKLSLHPALALLLSLILSNSLAAQEEKVEIYNSERLQIPLLPPEKALETMELPEGFRATVFAGDPHLRQPISMTFDARGRMWVVENYTYSERSLNFDTRLKDRILIFEDTDGDGRFDERKIFWDQGRKLTSVEIGFGGVWATCAPHLIFIPDADHDDVPDGEPEIHLDGWNEGPVRHNIVNGLKWGPDGWLYGRHGIQANSRVGPPGMPAAARTLLNACIWRYHPLTRAFEVVAEGTTNSWGHDWNDRGQLFFINTVIGHLWHVMPGAQYERMYGTPFNPHTYELLPQTADHYHWDRRDPWNAIRKEGVSDASSKAGGGHAHSGMMIYLGDNWPEEYHDDLFTVNYHGRRLNRERLERQGATYVGKHEPDLLQVGDVWFRGVEVTYGPDGGVYIADWSDVGECHDTDGVHRTSGRIYKVTNGDPEPPGAFDLRKKSSLELAELQTHANDWWVRRSRLVLAERAAAGQDLTKARERLLAMLDGEKSVPRQLRALWALHAIDGLERSRLLALLNHGDENLRVWAIQLLLDRELPPEPEVQALIARSKTEKSGLVLTFLASAMGRVHVALRLDLASALVRHGELAGDPVYPRMVWYGMEEAVAADPERAVELARVSEIPLLWRLISRRLTSEITEKLEPLIASLGKPPAGHEAGYRESVLEGMLQALRGLQSAEAPPGWKDARETLNGLEVKGITRRVRELDVIFGDGQALDAILAVAKNNSASVDSRLRAIRSLVQAGARDELEPVLFRLIQNRELGAAAVQGLAILNRSSVWKRLLDAYPKLREDGQEAAIEVLSSRVASADALLRAVAIGTVPREDIPAFQIRQMRSLGDENITARLEAFWPDLVPRTLSGEKKSLLERYRKNFTEETIARGNLESGRQVFQKNCGTCHRLHGEGGAAGPDLTGSNRKNLEYLFTNLVDPGAEVAETYQVSRVILKDGRILNGVLSARSNRLLDLQLPEEKVTLEKSAILSIQPTDQSLMPEGLLELLPEKERLDLLKYLTGS